jgi:hypothetical protein
MDGGYFMRPEFSLYGLNSRWEIENYGVEPDIVVGNRPDLVAGGHDPQLEKAIAVLLGEIRQHPKALPPRPPDLPPFRRDRSPDRCLGRHGPAFRILKASVQAARKIRASVKISRRSTGSRPLPFSDSLSIHLIKVALRGARFLGLLGRSRAPLYAAVGTSG